MKKTFLMILLISMLYPMVSCTTAPSSPEAIEAPETTEAPVPVPPETSPPEAVSDAGVSRPPVTGDDIPDVLDIPRLSNPHTVPPVEEKADSPAFVSAEADVDADDPEALPLPHIPPLPAPAPAAAPAENSPAAKAPAASYTAPSRVPAPAPAVAPAAPAESSAAAKTPAASFAAPTPEPETVTARPGDDITITLEGNGWIYLGAVPDGIENGPVQVRFLDRSSGNGNSRFLFSTANEGSAVLRFQLQNSAAGTRQLRNYHLTVSAEDPGAVEAASDEPSIIQGPVEPPPDRENKILAGIIERYRAGEKRDSLHSLRELLEKYKGVEALDIALVSALSAPAEGELPDFFTSEAFFDMLDRLAVSGGFGGEGELVRFLEWLLPAVPSGERDLYYYHLGRLIEEKLFPRDPARAVHYYSKIRVEYPWSRYWNDAVERERFLRRHFLELR